MLAGQAQKDARVWHRVGGANLCNFLDGIAQGHLTLYQVEDKHVESASYLTSMLPTLGLRTLDAMHLAIVQHHGFERIATADKIFADAAEAEALGFEADRFT